MLSSWLHGPMPTNTQALRGERVIVVSSCWSSDYVLQNLGVDLITYLILSKSRAEWVSRLSAKHIATASLFQSDRIQISHCCRLLQKWLHSPQVYAKLNAIIIQSRIVSNARIENTLTKIITNRKVNEWTTASNLFWFHFSGKSIWI